MVFESFYWKVEETSQTIRVQMKSNISPMYIYLQMHWHFEAGSTQLVGQIRIVSIDLMRHRHSSTIHNLHALNSFQGMFMT